MIITRAIELANEYKLVYNKYPKKLIVNEKTYENILKEVKDETMPEIFGMAVVVRFGGLTLGMTVE
mgnify:CR=1 FL=1|jgi:hypothetical protein